MNPAINIIIAEDDDLVREMIASFLKDAGIITLAQAGDGIELLPLLKIHRPDIILLDIDMPKMDGKQVLTFIKKTYSNLKVIMLTHYNDECIRTDFVEKGADGFLTKNQNIETIIKTIREVYKNRYVHPKPSARSQFTKRELTFIPLICKGKTMKEIANKLGVTEKTAEGHRQRLYKKTGCNSKAEFISYCASKGLKYLG